MIDAVKKKLEKEGISKIVIASRGGKSALKLAELVGKEVQVISVSEFSYNDDVKKKMKKLKMVPVENADLVIQDMKESREALLRFGSRVKAAVEVALIAKQRNLVEGDFLVVSGVREKDTALMVNGEMLESRLLSTPINEETIEEYITPAMIK